MLHARTLIWLGLLLTPTALRAQLAPRDSLHILKEARHAQFDFETARRFDLPRTPAGDSHECEVIVGRMCYWSDDDSDVPIPEPARIGRARMQLISTLDRLSAMSPADEWISGQRVHYLAEAGYDSSAVLAAHACRATRWWCEALLGFAEHHGGEYAQAESTWDDAIAAMPDSVRCRWTDISMLLDDGERDAYTRTPCVQRTTFEKRFWDLAQPSYAVRGNDRKTEHFSRVLLAELAATSTNTYGMLWGDDLRELLIRYGEPVWYERHFAVVLSDGDPTPTGHDRQPAYHFVADVTQGDSVRWDVREKGARERYSPPYIDSIADLDAQFAMMKRGDSALVVAVYSDTVGGPAVLGVENDAGDPIIAGGDTAHVRVRRAKSMWKGLIAGVEKLDPRRHIDERARAWLAPPTQGAGAPELSTLLLFNPTDTSVATLDDALAHALTANELRGTRKLGLYWEMYGVVAHSSDSAHMDSLQRDSASSPALRDSTAQADSSSGVSITVARIDGGVLKWLGQALHITRKDSPIAMRWHEAAPSDSVATRVVVLDLAQLPRGRVSRDGWRGAGRTPDSDIAPDQAARLTPLVTDSTDTQLSGAHAEHHRAARYVIRGIMSDVQRRE